MLVPIVVNRRYPYFSHRDLSFFCVGRCSLRIILSISTSTRRRFFVDYSENSWKQSSAVTWFSGTPVPYTGLNLIKILVTPERTWRRYKRFSGFSEKSDREISSRRCRPRYYFVFLEFPNGLTRKHVENWGGGLGINRVRRCSQFYT